jgi:hypothetical protein
VQTKTALEKALQEIKRRNEALRASEHDLNLIINTIPALVWSAPCCYTDTAGPDGFKLWAISGSRDYAILIAGTLCVGRSRRWRICVHTHHDDSRFSCVDTVHRGLIFLQPRLSAVRWIDPIVHFGACTP